MGKAPGGRAAARFWHSAKVGFARHIFSGKTIIFNGLVNRLKGSGGILDRSSQEIYTHPLDRKADFAGGPRFLHQAASQPQEKTPHFEGDRPCG
jgi:hypothetical protein